MAEKIDTPAESKLWDLFEVHEYPDDGVAESAMPQGVFYEFISSTFLKGIINYVKIFAVYLVLKEDDKVSDGALLEFLGDLHPKLGFFGTGVVVLAETENSHWVFWYDPDVSDCGVGRCEKDRDKEQFEKLFLDEIQRKEATVHKLPRLPWGWVSF